MRTTSPYKTAEELGIPESVRDGLIVLARDMANGAVPPERFDMRHSCGSACCIGGHLTERHVLRPRSYWPSDYPALDALFFPGNSAICCRDPQRGARAIVNFLTLGDPKWDDVMCEPDIADFDADDSGAVLHVLTEDA